MGSSPGRRIPTVVGCNTRRGKNSRQRRTTKAKPKTRTRTVPHAMTPEAKKALLARLAAGRAAAASKKNGGTPDTSGNQSGKTSGRSASRKKRSVAGGTGSGKGKRKPKSGVPAKPAVVKGTGSVRKRTGGRRGGAKRVTTGANRSKPGNRYASPAKSASGGSGGGSAKGRRRGKAAALRGATNNGAPAKGRRAMVQRKRASVVPTGNNTGAGMGRSKKRMGMGKRGGSGVPVAPTAKGRPGKRRKSGANRTFPAIGRNNPAKLPHARRITSLGFGSTLF